MDTYRRDDENSQPKKSSIAVTMLIAVLVALLLISLGSPFWGAPN